MSPSPELQSAANQAEPSSYRQPSGRRVGAPIHHSGRRRAAKFGAATAVAVTFASPFSPLLSLAHAGAVVVVAEDGPVSNASAFVTVTPTRLLDSRPGSGIDNGGVATGPYAPGTTTVVPIVGRADIPDDDSVVAIAISMTATASVPGFLTTWSGDGDRPNTSSLNVDASGPATTGVIVPVSSLGDIAIYNQNTTNVVVDVIGWNHRFKRQAMQAPPLGGRNLLPIVGIAIDGVAANDHGEFLFLFCSCTRQPLCGEASANACSMSVSDSSPSNTSARAPRISPGPSGGICRAWFRQGSAVITPQGLTYQSCAPLAGHGVRATPAR